MVKLLVEGGVDVNRKFTEMDEESKIRNATPIYLAVHENKNIEIVKFLVENGAGLNFLTSRGHGLLNKAIEKNNLEMVEYLLKNDTLKFFVCVRSPDEFKTSTNKPILLHGTVLI